MRINAEEIFEFRQKYSHVRGFVSEFQSNTRKKVVQETFSAVAECLRRHYSNSIG